MILAILAGCVPESEPSRADQIQLWVELEYVEEGVWAHYDLDVPADATSASFTYGFGTALEVIELEDFEIPSKLWTHQGAFLSEATIRFDGEEDVRVRAGVDTTDLPLYSIEDLVGIDRSDGTELHTVIYTVERFTSRPERFIDIDVRFLGGRFGGELLDDLGVTVDLERTNPDEPNSQLFEYPEPVTLAVDTPVNDLLGTSIPDLRLRGAPRWFDADGPLTTPDVGVVPPVMAGESMHMELNLDFAGIRVPIETGTSIPLASVPMPPPALAEVVLRQDDLVERFIVEDRTILELTPERLSSFGVGPLEVHLISQFRFEDTDIPDTRLVTTRLYRAGLWLE